MRRQIPASFLQSDLPPGITTSQETEKLARKPAATPCAATGKNKFHTNSTAYHLGPAAAKHALHGVKHLCIDANEHNQEEELEHIQQQCQPSKELKAPNWSSNNRVSIALEEMCSSSEKEKMMQYLKVSLKTYCS